MKVFVEGFSCALWEGQQHPWLLLTRCQQQASPPLFPVLTTETVSRYCQITPGEKIHVVDSHCCRPSCRRAQPISVCSACLSVKASQRRLKTGSCRISRCSYSTLTRKEMEEHYGIREQHGQTLRSMKWPGTFPKLWAVHCGQSVSAWGRQTGADPGAGRVQVPEGLCATHK